MTKHSHITTENAVRDCLMKTLCGRYVHGTNLPALYVEGGRLQRPLCPRCAAERLIAEVQEAK